MPKLILDRKVKYKRKSYPVNKKGRTKPIQVDSKDVPFFKNNDMILEMFDDEGKKMHTDEKDGVIEKLKAENKKLKTEGKKVKAELDKFKAQLAKKDEIIMDLEVEVEELKTGEVEKGNNEPGEAELNEVKKSDKQPKKVKPEVMSEEKKLEDKTVEELYEIAQDLDIKGRAKLRNDKDKLLKAIKEALVTGKTEKAGE